MDRFDKLTAWNPERDRDRRIMGANFLKENNIPFTIPSKGCFKIVSDKQSTIMFYPKSAKIVWKGHGKDKQHIFSNPKPDKILKKLNALI